MSMFGWGDFVVVALLAFAIVNVGLYVRSRRRAKSSTCPSCRAVGTYRVRRDWFVPNKFIERLGFIKFIKGDHEIGFHYIEKKCYSCGHYEMEMREYDTRSGKS